MQTVDVAKTRRRKEISIGLENGNIYHFQLAAFKIVHGGHYILGPRSKEVSAGKGTEYLKTSLGLLKIFKCIIL